MTAFESPSHLNLPRRRFLQHCATVAAATGLPGWLVESRLAQAAEQPVRTAGGLSRPHVALIGCGSMGKGDAGNAAHHGDVVAVCDVDAERVAEAAELLTTEDGKVPAQVRDFRELMARDDIDVIINATPDHWHTLINLAAARAGKDVYSEKPLTLTVAEGRQVVSAVNESGIVLQTGSQQRSSLRFGLVRDLVRSGRIGRLRKVDVWLPAGLREGPLAPAPAPDQLNWDYWQGPAPVNSYVPERAHKFFRYWYDYSGGTMTDWGAHHIDIANWVIGHDAPVRIEGRPLVQPIPGGYTAYSEYEVHYTYADGLRLHVCSTADDSIYGTVVNEGGQRHGILFTGDEGWIWVTRSQLKASSREILRRDGGNPPPSGDHMANFMDCVRSRALPRCHAEIGHRSASMCHLGVIALRTGLPLEWDMTEERFTGAQAEVANAYLSRPMRAPYDLGFVG
jgi:predicted dehydrogenase